MARKSVLPYVVAAAQSLTANFTTIPTVINYLDNVGYQITVTTTNSTGTFAVEVSNDYRPPASGPEFPVPNAGTWTPLTLGGSAVPNANATNDTITISLNQLPFSAIRLSYTSTVAGTGVAKIILFAKTVGA